MAARIVSEFFSVFRWGLAVFLLFLGSTVFAQDGTGSTAADFLNVDPGARAGSMGGAFTAMSADLSAMQYNPASAAGLTALSVVLHHASWYQSTFHEYAGFGFPLGHGAAVAVSFGYLHYGSIAGYDIDNNPTGDFSPSDAIISVAAARPFGDFVFLGVTGKYFRENLGEESLSGWAVDIGAQYRNGPFCLGLAALNLGPEIDVGTAAYPLPRRLRAGIGYAIGDRLLTAADIQLNADGSGSLHNGVEYTLTPNLFVRAGYRHQDELEGSATANSWTVGGGLIVSGAHFDYNYMPGGVLGDIHRFTIRFGN